MKKRFLMSIALTYIFSGASFADALTIDDTRLLAPTNNSKSFLVAKDEHYADCEERCYKIRSYCFDRDKPATVCDKAYDVCMTGCK